MTDNDLMAWLSPAADELTAEQRERVAEAARDIERRYPDPDEENDRQTALSATVQYLLGEITGEDTDRALVAARQAEREAYVTALQIAVMLHRDGMQKATAARTAGVDRMRLLDALGER